MRIDFNRPPRTGFEDKYVLESMNSMKMSGDGPFSKKCHSWFEEHLKCKKVLLTPSCTHALEMAAILLDLKEGDEVIMPSFTFVSTANAFVLRGAKIVFVDIRPDTMNIDENLIEKAITSRTKVIVPVHYGGVACEMDTIMSIAKKYNLYVVEDAAQGMMATYKNRSLGTIGHLGTYSFHETKNYTSGGEGGLLIINDDSFLKRSEVIREKGTNRSQFLRGAVDKYTWVDIGSSYLPSDLQAAYLWGQIQAVDQINVFRLNAWELYRKMLLELEIKKLIELPVVPSNCIHNAHMYYIKVKDIDERTRLIDFLKIREAFAMFHYVPLHSSVAGKKLGAFSGEDKFTTKESERLVRLPLWYGIQDQQIMTVVTAIKDFFESL